MPANEILQYDKRVIRVFISSTFKDMQKERDILIKKVFPQLRKLCEERAVSWTEVDLRWGITSEETSEGKVLPLCLEEIRRCRPYFIGLLGERYGWVPKEREIPQDLLDEQPWLREHREQSVTELEILHGVLRDPAMADRSLFYFRDPSYLHHLPEGASLTDFTPESPAAAGKLASLKESIRATHKEGKLLYQPRENYPDPEALGALVLGDFTGIIDELYPAPEVPDPLDQEAMRHEAYAASRRLAFVGREELLRRMDEHVAAAGAKPLVLTGESGCGKSALLAEWAARWREKNPNDLVIQHYTGSTPESADWQGLIRRVLGELKRAFAIADEVPGQPEAIRTALQEWLTKAAGQRRVVLVLDALNQLSADDPAARQLGWLPFVFPPNVRLLVSSLPGESLEALRRRTWPELDVPLFGRADIESAAEAYFAIFSKKLPREIIARLEDAPAAVNALYLRSVLDELRQFGIHEELEAKATGYLSAPGLPELFDRILTRWDEDFGQEKEHPDLVRRGLCLIACARFGLSEAELLDLLGRGNEPLPRRYWTPLYLAAENALARRAGLFTFGHDFLRAAAEKRWLNDDKTARRFRLHLVDYFGKNPEPTNRKLDELPVLLRDTGQWERLKELLADLSTFHRLRNHPRWKWELHGYWLVLEGRFDPVEVYRSALYSVFMEDPNPEQLAYRFNEVAAFHADTGRYTGAESLYRGALDVCGRLLSEEHPYMLTCVANLADSLRSKGDYAGAEPLCRRALEGWERVMGNEHPNTFLCVNNLAVLLESKGDYAGAEPLCRRALEGRERVLGQDHPDTLASVNTLAALLESKGDYAGAEPLYRRALEGSERVLGKEHPNTLASVNNLAGLLKSKGDYAGAEPLYRRALEGSEQVFGKEHPNTLVSVNNLAVLLVGKGDDAGAEPLYRRALNSRERIFGKEHPRTLSSVHNLASLFLRQGKFAEAEPLCRYALEARERVLGEDHPDTLKSVTNLADLLAGKGDYAGAEQLYRCALEGRERVLGQDHPDTLTSLSSLAGLLRSKGDYAGAEPLYRRALKGSEQVLGNDHPDTLASLNNLAGVLLRKGDSKGAEPLYRRALEARERVLGREHPDTLASMNNLAGLLLSQEDYTAELLYRQALETSVRVLGPEHPNTLASVNNLAFLLLCKGDDAEAEPLCRYAVEARTRVLGCDHPDSLISVNNLAYLLARKGDYTGAEELYGHAVICLFRISQRIGCDHPNLETAAGNYMEILKLTGLSEEQAFVKMKKLLGL